MKTVKLIYRFISSIIVLVFIISGFAPAPAAHAQDGNGVKRQINTQTGRVSFIGPESGSVLPAYRAIGTFVRPQDPAMALAKRFAPEFGLRDAERELTEMKANHADNGRVTVRYQQTYQDIPVMGGELIVNTNENGDLYSMNGEISPDLSLQTQPIVASEQATHTALQALAKWYQATSTDFLASEPELWIFDENLLQPSTRPVELVWRMEVTSANNSLPVRELVLVNAQRGNISLHFNQIDTAWTRIDDVSKFQSPEHNDTQIPPNNIDSNNEKSTIQPIRNFSPYLLGASWYVATTGDDDNDCTTTSTPCETINGAIGKATGGDTIYVSTGVYTDIGNEVVMVDKSINLLGGWGESFSTQTGTSTINGEFTRRGVSISTSTKVYMEYFTIQNGDHADGKNGISNDGNLTLEKVTIKNNGTNPTSGNVGGIYNSSTSILTLSYSAVIYNGSINNCFGGIWNSDGAELTVVNSTISGNISNTIYCYGAALVGYGTVSLKNATIVENTGDTDIMGAFGTFNLQNSIIGSCGNTTEMTSLGYNIISVNGCPITPTDGDQFGVGGAPINLLLGPLQDNSGPTYTHALMIGSPAIDAGNPATPGSVGDACLATDQRGVARPDGSRCDIGAFEGSVPFVSSPLVSTYTANNTASLPGTFLCNQTQPNCTNGSNPHADAAHKYAIGTHNLYATKHLRDSIDNNGMTIISTVHYKNNLDNASWNGSQMIYGDAHGWPLADDIVAHELTHGVTEYESNLFYYYQSGAINESFSDLWGEYYDQSNGEGNDSAGVKWLIGENITGLGAFRSMKNPAAFGDPDKISSVYYYEGADDNGGVHWNSGVNNKAVYLMVDGGSFNGKAVTALGWEKTAAIYYEANTNLLVSGADYSDLYYALQQACTNLIGQKGITSSDCTEVKDAVDAVQMNMQPAPNYNADVPLCPLAGTTPVITFADDLESGSSNWTFANGAYTRWQYDSPYGQYAQSGEHFLYADDLTHNLYSPYDPPTDARARLASFVVPPNAYLHFAHAYDFETGYLPGNPTLYNFDGGVLEYSTNGGATWVDAGSLISSNGYRGKIYDGFGNPLKGRFGFVGTSHGYISTRLSLASLAGQTVTFRWRMGLDEAVYAWGWWLDSVKIYKCLDFPTVSSVTRMDINPTNRSQVDFEVTFSKAVTGVDVSDFNLTTTDVSGASVSSVIATADTAVYTVTVDTGSGSGEIRLDVLDDDSIEDFSGNSLVEGYTVGETYTIVKATGVGVGVYDDTDPNWTYTGTWVAYSGSVPYANNTVHYTTGAEDDTASFTFSGTQFVLTYTQAPNRGVIEVYMDGEQVAAINANGALEFQKSYTSPVFPSGTHFVQFKHAGGGTYIGVDAIEVLATSAPGAGVYDDTHANWSYSGWTQYNGSKPYGATVHFISTFGGTASFTFDGTQFVLTYTQAPNRGNIDVYVDGTRIATVNATGPLQWQKVYISPVFSSGVHWVQFKHAGGGGAYVDVDAIQILDGSAPGVGVYDDGHANWSYSGSWAAYSGSLPFGNNTVHYTSVVGDVATFTFDGTQFVLTYTRAPNRGNIGVFVDGIKIATINATDALAFEQSYTSPAFSSGTHVVQFKHAGGGGGYVDVDGIEVLNTAAPGVGVYDDTHANWSYSGSWIAYSGSAPYANNTVHYTAGVGNMATFTFDGTQFVLTYTQAPNRGNIGVFVDGSQVTTINATGALAFEQSYTSPVFSSGVHVVQFKHAGGGGAYADVDAIEVLNTAAPGTGVYDDTHANWSYSGSWAAYSGSAPYANNTAHYTAVVGDTAAFTFDGTQFVLTYTQAPNRGNIGVFVDGLKITTINATGALQWQKKYTSPTFSAGSHVVQFKHAGSEGAFIDLDAIQVK